MLDCLIAPSPLLIDRLALDFMPESARHTFDFMRHHSHNAPIDATALFKRFKALFNSPLLLYRIL